MSKVYLFTGFFKLHMIELEINGGDVLGAIDEFVLENGIEALGVAYYKPEEIDSIFIDDYLPINGGEYYIMGVSHVL